MNENRKYQIFISSTYVDLKDERRAVIKSIMEMMHFPVGMEMFSPTDKKQWEIIKSTIDTSDYYVLILGQRYGSTVKNGKDNIISYTEKEFNYARRMGKPILAFIISDSAMRLPNQMESDQFLSEKLRAFKGKVKKSGRIVDWWLDGSDLARKVVIALTKEFIETPSCGWVRNLIPTMDRTPIEKSFYGKFILIYYSSFGDSDDAIFSDLTINADSSVVFRNNTDVKRAPEYFYEGNAYETATTIEMDLANKDSSENVYISLEKSPGKSARYLGLIMAKSSTGKPVCVKVACIKSEEYKRIKQDKLKAILMGEETGTFNRNAFIFSEMDTVEFNSNNIMVV